MARYFSSTDIEEFKECFSFHARRGYISRDDELSTIMRSLGFSPTIEEVKAYYKQYAKDGRVEFAEFLDIMHSHSTQEKCQEEILAAFKAHDTKKTGYVSAAEIRNMLTGFGEKLTRREVDALLKEANVGSSGKIRYADFVKNLLVPIPDY